MLRIFRSYAEAKSLLQVAKMLNQEGIPPPRGKSWSKHAIQHILQNTRYIGKLRWGSTKEVRDPETGRKERRDLPPVQWDTREAPELRIVSDELWASVADQRARATHKIGIQRSGGMSRTEAARNYLLSGLGKCGSCGGNMVIVTNNPSRYGCANHRHRGNCANRATIKQIDLELAFVQALSANLRKEELREDVVLGLYEHLQGAKIKRMGSEQSTADRRVGLETSRRTQATHQENILKAIREGCGARALYEDLVQVEARIARIDETLATSVKVAAREIGIDEVREFVNSHVHLFEELLLGAPERVRHEFQKRISTITLTPSVDERGPVYRVTGDVDLFSVAEGVVQTNQVELIGLHYTISCRRS